MSVISMIITEVRTRRIRGCDYHRDRIPPPDHGQDNIPLQCKLTGYTVLQLKLFECVCVKDPFHSMISLVNTNSSNSDLIDQYLGMSMDPHYISKCNKIVQYMRKILS